MWSETEAQANGDTKVVSRLVVVILSLPNFSVKPGVSESVRGTAVDFRCKDVSCLCEPQVRAVSRSSTERERRSFLEFHATERAMSSS